MPPPLFDALQLRELKYGTKVTPAQRSAAARRLLEAGRTAEALDLFAIAGDENGVGEIRRIAVEGGRPTLLLMLRRLNRPVTEAEWKRAAERAMTDGRFREAFRAFHEASDQEGLGRVRAKLPDYEIYTPQGK